MSAEMSDFHWCCITFFKMNVSVGINSCVMWYKCEVFPLIKWEEYTSSFLCVLGFSLHVIPFVIYLFCISSIIKPRPRETVQCCNTVFQLVPSGLPLRYLCLVLQLHFQFLKPCTSDTVSEWSVLFFEIASTLLG